MYKHYNASNKIRWVMSVEEEKELESQLQLIERMKEIDRRDFFQFLTEHPWTNVDEKESLFTVLEAYLNSKETKQ